MAALSQFALVIQDIATTDLNSLGGPTKTVTVEEYKYDGNKVVLVTKTTRTVPDDDKTTTGTELPKARIDYRGSDSRLRSLLHQRFR
jgi:hypothetical protein